MRISREDTRTLLVKSAVTSPFTILSCRATQSNLVLPEYSGLNANVMGQQRVCGCPNAVNSNVTPASSTNSVPTMDAMNGPGSENAIPSLTRPPQVHLSTNAAAGVQSRINMLSTPSFKPPVFDEEQPLPPLATPPPLYDHVIGTPSHDGLADYFARHGCHVFLVI